MKSNFLLVEPSKVGDQHITFISSYIEAINLNKNIMDLYNFKFIGSSSTIENLEVLKNLNIKSEIIFVVNPDKRRLVFKTLVEFYQVVRLIFKKNNLDILLISCILPTSLIFIEILNKLANKKNIFIVLHGEIEGILNSEKHDPRRIGFWSNIWFSYLCGKSKLRYVVIDKFIKDKLNLIRNNLEFITIPQPIKALHFKKTSFNKKTLCFIGYRTKNKGYEIFKGLAKDKGEYNFIAIGGGIVENLSDGSIQKIKDREHYLNEISKADIALFLYTDGYQLTLSGAALDAISVGVPILALPRPFFSHLNSVFGDNIVLVKSSLDEIIQSIDNKLCDKNISENFNEVNESVYSLHNVSKSFDKIIKLA